MEARKYKRWKNTKFSLAAKKKLDKENMTMRMLARKLNTSPQMISMVLHGKAKSKKIEEGIKIELGLKEEKIS